jgi:cytochrome c
MIKAVFLGLFLILSVAIIWTLTATNDEQPSLARGKELLQSNCARCHAIGSSGNSPHAEAPPFRRLGQRYSIDNLAEALAEGLSTGHPDMPEFMFEPEDVGAILAYLHAIQAPDNVQRRKQ